MFDDLKNEPEDMFEQTDKVAPQVTAPTDQPVSPPEAPVISVPPLTPAAGSMSGRIAELSPEKGGFPWKTIVLIVGIIVVVVAAFFLSMKILGSRASVTPTPPVDLTQENVPSVEDTTAVVEEPVVEEVTPEPVSLVDTDKDGLSDEEEAGYGTSPRVADTDSDGLFDREEIMTWGTDPLNPDTDGDGYLDGEEVLSGHDPLIA